MSYIRRPRSMSGVSSQPPGRRISNRALTSLSGVSSSPRGPRVARRALGGSTAEYSTIIGSIATDIVNSIKTTFGGGSASGTATTQRVAVPPPRPGPIPYPSREGRLSVASRLGLSGTLADDAAPTVVDPDTRAYQKRSIELQSELVAAQQHWAQGDEKQKWIQIAATVMIPVTAAIWRAIGVGRKRTPT